MGLEGKVASPGTCALVSPWALGEGAHRGKGWGVEFGGGGVLAILRRGGERRVRDGGGGGRWPGRHPRPPRGLLSPCGVSAQEIWSPGPALPGGAQPRAGERFRSGEKTPTAPCAGGRGESPERGPEPGLTLGGTLRGGGGAGRGGGCGPAGVAAALCLQAPVDPRGNRRRRSHGGSESGERGAEGVAGPRGGVGVEVRRGGGGDAPRKPYRSQRPRAL